jgi:hypothetical protein
MSTGTSASIAVSTCPTSALLTRAWPLSTRDTVLMLTPPGRRRYASSKLVAIPSLSDRPDLTSVP